MSLAENIRRTGVLPGELAVCWLGQAGFLLKDCQGKVLVIDPYLSNCGEQMRGFKRLSPILLAPEELTPDYYLITHLHFDHFDYETVPKILERGTSPLFLGPSSCREKLLELGAPSGQCVRLDRGESYRDTAVSIRAVTADHGTMAPDAIGVLLERGGYRLYFSGDTAYREDIFQAAAAFRPDMAMLSVNGRFGNMNAQEGARAAALCGAKYAVPCHFWTFAEHGGDPGDFCRHVQSGGRAVPLCFCQGEIRILSKEKLMQRGKEPA